LLRLATRPNPTGSSLPVNTIGTVVVAALAATPAGRRPPQQSTPPADRPTLSAVDEASFAQTLPQSGEEWRKCLRRRAVREPNHRYRRLLRACCKRQCRRAADKRDEVAPSNVTCHVRPCQQAKLARGAKDKEYAMSPKLKPRQPADRAEPELASRV